MHHLDYYLISSLQHSDAEDVIIPFFLYEETEACIVTT